MRGRPTKQPKKSPPKKNRTGENVYIGKYEHIFNHKWNENEIKALADELIEWYEKNKTQIGLDKFFNEKRITPRRIGDTFKKVRYFEDIYSICMSTQKERMFDSASDKSINPAIYILGLKNNHGWTDKPVEQSNDQSLPEITINVRNN